MNDIVLKQFGTAFEMAERLVSRDIVSLDGDNHTQWTLELTALGGRGGRKNHLFDDPKTGNIYGQTT